MLNQKLGGWANYFKLSPITKAYRFLEMYRYPAMPVAVQEVQAERRGIYRYPDEYFHQQVGLACLTLLPESLPWAKT